jgi:two-component system sensor histidine kinase DesK
MAEVEHVSREALAEVRRAVHGYRAASLADEIVRAKAVLQTAGIAVASDAPALHASSGNAAPEIEHAAAMVLREAVTNVIRHARATRCSIEAHIREGQLVVRVTDDGVGGPVLEGAGIDSMRARAREIGGTLDHQGRSSRGVVVTFRAPLSRPT